MSIHKAAPSDEVSAAKQPCRICGWNVKRVPGGQGPTWVHTVTGTVVGEGGE